MRNRKWILIVLVLALTVSMCACRAAPAAEKPEQPAAQGPGPETPEPKPEEPGPAPEEPAAEDGAPETGDEPASEDGEEPAEEPALSGRALAVQEVMEDLNEALAGRLDGLDGKWAVYVEDMDTGCSARGEYGVTCDESMVSASMIKIFVAAAAYDAIDRGVFSEDELSDTIYNMIVYSDNDATNRLVTTLGGGDAGAGMALVNAYNESIGCGSSRMERLMLVDDGTQNYVSETDCARLLRMIYEGECVSAAYSEKMLSTLKDQYWKDYLNQGAPADTVIAHKTGDLTGICQGDVGIVYGEGGPYIACIICNDAPDYYGNIDVIIDLAGIVYDHMALRPAEDEAPEAEHPEPPPSGE